MDRPSPSPPPSADTANGKESDVLWGKGSNIVLDGLSGAKDASSRRDRSKETKKVVFAVFDVDALYSPQVQAQLRQITTVEVMPMNNHSMVGDLNMLRDVEILFSGWGGPLMDKKFVQTFPNLQAVFFAGGTVKPVVTEAFWEREIPISSAWAANAVPVAEFTLAQIILALKHIPYRTREMHNVRRYPRAMPSSGAYRSRVGLIGLGMIGRMVLERLKILDVEIAVYDPRLTPEKAAELGVVFAGIEELFSECQVVSLHVPLIESTRGMITATHFERMREGTTFINTSRGENVREEEMIAVLQRRPDIFVVLDVSRVEPPEPDSPLYVLPNVCLTPHVAGSVGNERWRMGDYMVEEWTRYCCNEPLRWRVTREMAQEMT